MWHGRILKRTLEISLKVFDKIQVKFGKMKIPKRQSSSFNNSCFCKLLIYVTSIFNWSIAISANFWNLKNERCHIAIFPEFRYNTSKLTFLPIYVNIERTIILLRKVPRSVELTRTWKIQLFEKSENTKNDKIACSTSRFIVYKLSV